MSNCLVTGGAGFIGSHVVEALLAGGAQVTVFDNFDQFYPRAAKFQNLETASRFSGFRLIEGDICNRKSLHLAAAPYDCIVHLAAKAGVRQSIATPTTYERVNVTGTQNVLEFARECSVPQFIFASSSSVYGVNVNTPWREEDRQLPISPYASTKLSGELLGHVYAHLYGIRFIALRFFSVYGPRQRPDLAIRKFAEFIRAGRPVPIYGDGSAKRDYTYIDDIVVGIRSAIAYAASRYEVINLGNSRPLSLLELIRSLEHALGEKARLEFHPEQPGDLHCTFADITKARELLAYHPDTSFVAGIARFADWLSSQGTAFPRLSAARLSRRGPSRVLGSSSPERGVAEQERDAGER